ncbi:MAG: ATP-dependent endonuclease [Anaerolineae bacterium]|nr:ATP-dependent endonuclease [Anaerolineae bacterium]
MIIKKIRVQNFRSIKDETLECEGLTVLVGPNGAGKSAFLHALNIFYTPNANYSEEDFYNRDISEPISITVIYSNLAPAEKQLFAPYIDGDVLAITKECSYPRVRGSEKYFGMRRQCPEFAKVRTASDPTEKKKLYSELRALDKFSDLPQTPSRAADINNYLEEWEANHPEACEWQRDNGQFFGFKEVGTAKLERFTRFLFIPAVRDASIDAVETRGSVLTDLMDIVVRSTLTQNEALRTLKEETQRRYSEIMDTSAMAAIRDLEKQLTEALQSYAPGAAVSLRWQPAGIEIPPPKAEAFLVEDEFQAPVNRTGHGLQRAFIIAMLQQIAVTQAQLSSAREPLAEPDMHSLILGIEEPELYQHPDRQRYLARVLSQLTEGGIRGVVRAIQVIYTTHSPLFVGIDRFNQIRLVRKEYVGKDLPKQTRVRFTTLNQVAKRIERAVRPTTSDQVAEREESAQGAPASRFAGDTLIPRTVTLMNPWMNEGFFAEVVVLVEGSTDRAALLSVAEQMGVDFEKLGIALIPCEGKNNLDRPYAIFQSLDIPVYLIWDSDYEEKDARPVTNHYLLRLVGVAEPDNWPARIEPHFACFKYNLNRQLEADLGDECYSRLLDQSRQKYELSREQAEKNPVVISEIIKAAYEQGYTCATLEQIIQHIQGLRRTQ